MTDKRKRAAPTIDLTATEMSSAADESETTPQPEPTPPESAPQPKPAPSESVAQPEPPAGKAPQGAEQTTEQHEPARRRGGFGAAIAAGLAGGIVATGVLAAAWYLGLLPAVPVTSNGESAQIAALQKQVQDLQNRPAPATDNQAVDALSRRVAKIEHDIVNLPPGDTTVAERLAAADNAMKSLGVALSALTKRSDDIAAKANQAEQRAAAAEKAVSDLRDSVKNAASQASSAIDPAQLADVQKRIAGLEQQVTAVREQTVKEIAKEIAKTPAVDVAARLALSAASLRDAVESGAPYKTELAQAKSLDADAKALAPLEMFAASGVPSKAALAQQLTALIPAMLKASGAQKPPAGFLERLQANAGSLVHIRPVNAPVGDAPADVLARIEVAAAHADIDGALADLGKLPGPARAPAQAWIAKAKARQQALAAARVFAADAAGKLGKR
jgi:hypothetical protein